MAPPARPPINPLELPAFAAVACVLSNLALRRLARTTGRAVREARIKIREAIMTQLVESGWLLGEQKTKTESADVVENERMQ